MKRKCSESEFDVLGSAGKQRKLFLKICLKLMFSLSEKEKNREILLQENGYPVKPQGIWACNEVNNDERYIHTDVNC